MTLKMRKQTMLTIKYIIVGLITMNIGEAMLL